jgi:hypothetical protein
MYALGQYFPKHDNSHGQLKGILIQFAKIAVIA